MLDVATQTLPVELERAAERFDAQQDRWITQEGYGSTDYGLGVAGQCVPRFTEGLKELLKDKELTAPKLRLKLQELEPEVLALCVLQTAINCIATSENLRDTRVAIAAALEGECWAAELTHIPSKRVEKAKRLNAKQDIERRIAQAEKRAGRRMAFVKRQAEGEKAAEQEDYNLTDWSVYMQAKAGHFGVNALLIVFPDVFVVKPDGREHQLTIDETSDAHKQAEDMVAQAVLRKPVWLPITQLPRAWTQNHKGGTWDARLAHSLTVVRTRHKHTQAAVRNAIHDATMQPALDGLNALQSVPWTINKRILGVIYECRRKGIEVKGVPTLTDPDRIVFQLDVNTAELMSFSERFWTPMNLDWRGRVYGVPSFNFQRDDRVRALFLFADGEPIGEEGLYWLKVHVANCGDFDKISKRPFDERVQWVTNNLETIFSYTELPLKELGWTGP